MNKRANDNKQQREDQRREQINDYEQSFLGSLLSYGFNEIPQLKIQAECFQNTNHRLIFQTYLNYRKDGKKPDIVMMASDPALRDIGPSYIANLTTKIPSVANIAFYEGEIIKAWQTRTSKQAAHKFLTRIESADFTGEIENELRTYTDILSGALCEFVTKETKSPIVTYTEYRQRRKDRKYWEEFTPVLFNRLPFPNKTINLIGARSGAGKTNALINIMRELLNTSAPEIITNNKHREQARNAVRRMVFVSREMSIDDIFDRLALSLAWTIKDKFSCLNELKEDPFFNMQRFHNYENYPDTTPEETFEAYYYVFQNIIEPAAKNGRLIIQDAIETETLEKIIFNLTLHNIGPGDVVFIDYIQLLPATKNKEAERYATADHLRMRYILRELHKVASKSEAIFICAAQLNRDAAKIQTEGKINIETAFKDSADLEQCAHSAVIINRQDGKEDKPPKLSYHVVKARSSRHLGQHRDIKWKPGFYHMEIEHDKKPTQESTKTKTDKTGNNETGSNFNWDSV